MMRRPFLKNQKYSSQSRQAGSSVERRGLTLVEVVVALSIFMISSVTLGQLVATGARAAVLARLQTQAILHCESKIAEVLSGILPMETVSNAAMENNEDWTWSLDIQTGPHPDLLQLIVTVDYVVEGSLANGSFSLSRLVRDPEIFIEEDLVEEDG